MLSSHLIRPARPEDISSLHELINSYVASKALLARSEEFIELNLADYLVAVPIQANKSQVLACAQLDEYSPSLVELRSLAVRSGFQSQGLGRQVSKAIIDLARRREYQTIFAVSQDQDFFASLGFAPRSIPELKPYRSEISPTKGVFALDLVVPEFIVRYSPSAVQASAV